MYLKQLFIFALLSILLGCAAGSGESRDGGERISTGSNCVSEGTIRSYEVLNDSNLVVRALANRYYHVELHRRASGLRTAWNIGFSSPSSLICASFSDLIVGDNFGPERYRIRSIRQLSTEEYEDLRYRFGKDGAKKQQPPEPEDVSGAEVEELD